LKSEIRDLQLDKVENDKYIIELKNNIEKLKQGMKLIIDKQNKK